MPELGPLPVHVYTRTLDCWASHIIGHESTRNVYTCALYIHNTCMLILLFLPVEGEAPANQGVKSKWELVDYGDDSSEEEDK